MKFFLRLSELERYRWITRGLLLLVFLLALVAGLFQEELRLEHIKVLRLQNTIQNTSQNAAQMR